MKRLGMRTFVFGLVLVATGIVATTVYAVVQQNEKCITVLPPQKCNSSASSYCSTKAQNGTCDGLCSTCDSSLGVPSKICVYWEGCTCTEDWTQCVNCGNTDLLRGECTVANGICQCTNMQKVGTCPDGQSACWCPG
jgi:hypothetical protein